MAGISEIDSIFRIKQIRTYNYSFPFKNPLRAGRETLKTRDGTVIELIDTQGLTGWGEIAPLRGFSKETPEQVKPQVSRLIREFQGQDILMEKRNEHTFADFPSPCLPGKNDPLDSLMKELCPPVRFGLETACLHLWEKRFAGDSREYGRQPLKREIRVNALLHPGPNGSGMERQLKDLIDSGFKTIKIKVGRYSLEDDIHTVTRTSQMLPPDSFIRLDANRLWDLNTALAFGRAVRDTQIEYIEEPLSDASGIRDFYSETGIPVALDESLETLEPGLESIPDGVSAIVLKPSILGGIGRTLDFIGTAEKMGLKPVISSCFETGPGFAALLKIAQSIHFDDSASGLDTLKYLEQNLFLKPVNLKNGGILPEETGSDIFDNAVNTDLLSPLYTQGKREQ